VICPPPVLAPLLVTLRVCGAGATPLSACENDSEVALTLIVLDDTTFNVTRKVTFTVCGLTPGDDRMI
jgi:hypothetical protein